MGWPKTDDQLDKEEKIRDDKEREYLLKEGLLLCSYKGCMNYIDPNDGNQVISGLCERCLGDAQ